MSDSQPMNDAPVEHQPLPIKPGFYVTGNQDFDSPSDGTDPILFKLTDEDRWFQVNTSFFSDERLMEQIRLLNDRFGLQRLVFEDSPFIEAVTEMAEEAKESITEQSSGVKYPSANERPLAMEYALRMPHVGLLNSTSQPKARTASDVVADAKVFEAYLSGSDE